VARDLPSSPRLTFRWWRADDLPLARGLWGDPEVTRYIDARPQLGPDEVAERLRAEIEAARADRMQYWPMFLADGTHVGAAGLRPHTDRVLELGFHIRTQCAGQGLATEAARAVIAHAWSHWSPGQVDALFAGHNPDNTASRRVLTKLGFAYTHDELYAPTGRRHPCYRLER